MRSTAEQVLADKATMRSIIQRIATGPELSKDISQEETRAGMQAILDGVVDPVQAAVFLIALRMKRETDEENLGVLGAILNATETVTADVDEVVDIADPYDGYNRSLPTSTFLPAVLAAMGIPTVCHGLEAVSPKYGITHRHVLKAAGKNVDMTTAEAAAQLSDPEKRWAYVDQKKFCPKLHNLVDLRTLIVKRPAITTAEVLSGPIRGHNKTHLITGYVHKPYPRIYAILARHANFDTCLMVRGVEGGVIPSLRQTGRMFYYHDKGEEQSIDVKPEELGINQKLRAVPLPDDLPAAEEKGDGIAVAVNVGAAAKAATEMGLEALDGKEGMTRDALIYGGALCLWHLKRHDGLPAAADAVREVLDNGKALACFNKY